MAKMLEIAREAIVKKLCFEFVYAGYARVAEVHAVGESQEGNIILRVWQVQGGSASGEPVGWKLLRLDEISLGKLSNIISKAPRPGYKRGDRQMAKIMDEI